MYALFFQSYTVTVLPGAVAGLNTLRNRTIILTKDDLLLWVWYVSKEGESRMYHQMA